MSAFQNLPWIILILPAISSCSFLVPNKMFKTPDDFVFTELIDSIPHDYQLRPGDQFELYIFSNNGYKLVDPIITGQDAGYSPVGESLIYELDINGESNLPLIGNVNLLSLTEKEAEDRLEELFKQHYIEPFVRLTVTNRRVTVFRGNAMSVVVPLKNQNITIMEVIGAAGGVPPTGKSNKIKLIREQGNKKLVSLIDLSTIEGIEQAGTIVQANDIIYIDPTINTEFFKEIAPIISVVSGLLIIYIYFANINK